MGENVYVINFLALIFMVLTPGTLQAGETDWDASRQEMVSEQIEARGITDQATLFAMRTVPRHLFVDKSLASRAYNDSPLPIGHGQTISQPYIVAYMTEIIAPSPGMTVLEIGTGSGYQAAVLSQIVKHVYSIEIIKKLADSAEKRLSGLKYDNVTVINADGYYGLPSEAPFDAIIVTAASEFIPPPLISQLKEGGKMIIPVGSPFLVQTLMLVEKKDGSVKTTSLVPVRFVPFRRTR